MSFLQGTELGLEAGCYCTWRAWHLPGTRAFKVMRVTLRGQLDSPLELISSFFKQAILSI